MSRPPTLQTLQRFQQTQDQLSNTLSRLLVVVERYPELKANANFQELQAQLEGTENRIAVERRKLTKQFRPTTQPCKPCRRLCLPDCLAFPQDRISRHAKGRSGSAGGFQLRRISLVPRQRRPRIHSAATCRSSKDERPSAPPVALASGGSHRGSKLGSWR